MICDSCDALHINGVKCHEHGCPAAWKDKLTECFECGFEFKPSFRYQSICDSCIEDREYREELVEEENA